MHACIWCKASKDDRDIVIINMFPMIEKVLMIENVLSFLLHLEKFDAHQLQGVIKIMFT